MTQQDYHLTNIRALLVEGFTDEELRRLCFDTPGFRPVYDELARGTGKWAIADRLLEHADRTMQIPALLALAEERKPKGYQQHGPYYVDELTTLRRLVLELSRQLASRLPAPPEEEKPLPPEDGRKWARALLLLAAALVLLGAGLAVGMVWRGATATKEPARVGLPVAADTWDAFLMDRSGGRANARPQVAERTLAGETIDTVAVNNALLRSGRNADGWTEIEQSLVFEWSHPIQDNTPYAGMIARLFLEPAPEDESDLVFCRFFADYELADDGPPYTYAGSEHLIAPDQWNTLVWDFTGNIWHEGQPWQAAWESLRDQQLADAGHYYAFIQRRLGENAFDDAFLAKREDRDTAWADRFQSLGLQCFVSATQAYTTAEQPTFQGDFHLGQVWVQPIDALTIP